MDKVNAIKVLAERLYVLSNAGKPLPSPILSPELLEPWYEQAEQVLDDLAQFAVVLWHDGSNAPYAE